MLLRDAFCHVTVALHNFGLVAKRSSQALALILLQVRRTCPHNLASSFTQLEDFAHQRLLP